MRQFIDSHDLAGEIRMERSLDPRAILIVEGATDARLFERFVDHEHCYVLAAHDRERAVSVLRILNALPLSGVLAIVDADFGRITGTLETDSNLLFCDGHDLEIMLIQSQALDRLVAEHASANKLAAFLANRKPQMLMASLLVHSCLPLGALLMISLRLGLTLKFDDLTFRDFVNSNNLQIDVTSLVRSVLNKSSCHDRNLETQLLQELHTILSEKTIQIWNLARGHDCIELLAFALRAAIGTKKSKTSDRKSISVNSELLERELRLTFSEADFATTLLIQGIHEWEFANSDYRVLSK